MADGAFLDAFHAVGADYPYIDKKDIFVDNLAMALAMNPAQFGCSFTTESVWRYHLRCDGRSCWGTGRGSWGKCW